MKILFYFSFFVASFILVCCNQVGPHFYYEKQEFIKISSYADSVKENYVIYKSVTDSSVTMLRNYWQNGRIQAISMFKKNQKDGKWLRYFDDGMISFEGYYSNGKKDGIHKTFYPSGETFLIEEYKNGKRIASTR